MGGSVPPRPRKLALVLGDQEKGLGVLEQQGVHFQGRGYMVLNQDMVLYHPHLEEQEVLQWAMMVRDIHLP